MLLSGKLCRVGAALACALPIALAAHAQDGEYAGNKTCVMCHGAQAKFWKSTKHAQAKPATDAPEDKWRHMTGEEEGVNCEACHGPNKAHVEAPLNKKLDAVAVYIPDLERMQLFALCARCHSTGVMPDGAKYPAGYKQGGLLPADYKLVTPPKGTPFRQWNDMQGSKHVTDPKGATCITCHAPHSEAAGTPMLRKPVNELCGSCHHEHEDMKHAKKATAKSKCSDCHMPNGLHVFKAPE